MRKAWRYAVVIAAMALPVTAFGFGWSRDFGDFLLGLMVLPLLAIVLLAAMIGAGLQGVSRRALLASLAIACMAPVCWHAADSLRDPIRFALWAPMHEPQLERAILKNGILVYWDGWGMAGMENDSYLAVDVHDRIAAPPAAEIWRKELHLDCEIVEARRMRAKLYIVTTYNCPVDAPFSR